MHKSPRSKPIDHYQMKTFVSSNVAPTHSVFKALHLILTLLFILRTSPTANGYMSFAPTSFRANANFGLQVSAAALTPSAVIHGVGSPVKCAQVCVDISLSPSMSSSSTDKCQSFVYLVDSRACLVYAARFMRPSDVINNPQAVYMEQYPPASFQVGSRSCTFVQQIFSRPTG